MVLVSDDVEHLREIQSPFLSAALERITGTETSQWLAALFPDYSTFVNPISLPVNEFLEILAGKTNGNELPVLAGFSHIEIEELGRFSTFFQLEPGTRIVRHGDMSQEIYLILDGVAEVFKSRVAGSDPVLFATLGRGDIFGEMGVLTGKPRSADVIAASVLEVIFIDRVTLQRLMKSKPDLAAKLVFNIAKVLAERLDSVSVRLAEVV